MVFTLRTLTVKVMTTCMSPMTTGSTPFMMTLTGGAEQEPIQTSRIATASQIQSQMVAAAQTAAMVMPGAAFMGPVVHAMMMVPMSASLKAALSLLALYLEAYVAVSSSFGVC